MILFLLSALLSVATALYVAKLFRTGAEQSWAGLLGLVLPWGLLANGSSIGSHLKASRNRSCLSFLSLRSASLDLGPHANFVSPKPGALYQLPGEYATLQAQPRVFLSVQSPLSIWSYEPYQQ